MAKKEQRKKERKKTIISETSHEKSKREMMRVKGEMPASS